MNIIDGARTVEFRSSRLGPCLLVDDDVCVPQSYNKEKAFIVLSTVKGWQATSRSDFDAAIKLGYARSTSEGGCLQGMKQTDVEQFRNEVGKNDLGSDREGKSVLSNTDSEPGISVCASIAKEMPSATKTVYRKEARRREYRAPRC